MKKLFILALFAGFILAGCSKDLNVTGPQPAQVTQLAKQSTDFSASKLIDGAKGGNINLNVNSNGVKVKAHLKVPAGAFANEKEISFVVDPAAGTIVFSPEGNFNTDIRLDLTIDGVNADGFSGFNFLDGSEVTEYSSLKITDSKLEVKKAKIAHFSRYGFVK